MVASLIVPTSTRADCFPRKTSVAAGLKPAQRKDLSLQVLARQGTVTQLAERHQVSRKFLYKQAAKGSDALDKAFDPTSEEKRILFHLPVSKQWIRQFVLALVLVGHSSFRGVCQILRDTLDYHDLSIGTVHNILAEAVDKARLVNHTEDLSRIRVGAHDEIYQAGKPVLAGADLDSTYCYLLSSEDHADETTWGVRLLELAERGLQPKHTVADGGTGLRAGQAAAWPNIPCHGDVFHAEMDLGKLAFYLQNRAAGTTMARQKLERRMECAKKRRRGNTVSKKLTAARQAEAQAVPLACDIQILAQWVKNDILSLAGPNYDTRMQLFDFVVEELHLREPLAPHRIRPVRRTLENQRRNLLAFAEILTQEFDDLAVQFKVSVHLLHALCELQGMDRNRAAYWEREKELRQKLRGSFHELQIAVCKVMSETARASSLVENLNSRLRNYFFLRRHIGNDYLVLLRFFLNHNPLQRSRRPERVGKSPAELLTGKVTSHWLELLGFERFQRN